MCLRSLPLRAKPLSVAIVGSRGYPHLGVVRQFVSLLPPDTTIVSGGALGVDQAAARAAQEFGLELVEYLPDWEKHGKRAGFLRNQDIVQRADVVFAFWDGTSRGTKSSIELAEKYGRPVRVFR